jgi:hypothetical protein
LGTEAVPIEKTDLNLSADALVRSGRGAVREGPVGLDVTGPARARITRKRRAVDTARRRVGRQGESARVARRRATAGRHCDERRAEKPRQNSDAEVQDHPSPTKKKAPDKYATRATPRRTFRSRNTVRAGGILGAASCRQRTHAAGLPARGVRAPALARRVAGHRIARVACVTGGRRAARL